jgi:hypothetical protein
MDERTIPAISRKETAMPEDTAAVVVTVAFFVVMAAWIPLVMCCEKTMRKLPERERQNERGRVVEMKRPSHAEKGSGYETAVLITMAAAVCSLGLFN